MPRIHHDVAPFLAVDPQTGQEVISLLVARPNPEELEHLGRLFGVFQVGPANDQTRRIVELLQSEAKITYYQQLESNVELAFEHTLKHLNELLARELEQQHAAWLDNCNILLGVLRNDEVFFTQVGDIQAFLAHKLRIINILDKTRGVETRLNPLKIFSQTISGQLTENDALVLCTTSLLDYLSQERLRTIVQANTAQYASTTLEHLLRPNVSRQGFGALIFKIEPEVAPVRVTPRPAPMATPQPMYGSSASQESMDKMLNREASTNQLLSPSAWLNLKKLSNTIRGGVSSTVEKVGLKPKLPARATTDHQQLYTPTRELQKPTVRRNPLPPQPIVFLLRIFVGLRGFFQGLGKGVGSLGQSVTRREPITQKLNHLPTKAADTVAHRVVLFQRLTKQRKVALIIAAVLIFIFAQSVIAIGRSRENKALNAQYDQSIASAREKADAAEAAMLYGDEDGAKTLLNETRQLIDSIPEKKRQKTYKSAVDEITVKLGVISEKTKHVVEVAEPTLVADLQATSPEIQPAAFVGLLNGQLVTYASNQQQLLKTSLSPAETKSVPLPEAITTQPALSVAINDNRAVILFQDGTSQQYDATNDAFTALTITYANQDKELKGGAVYNDRLYLLDTKNSQVFRHNRSANAFGTGTGWIKDVPTTVENGQAITIDGSLYLLRNDGTVTRFFQGAAVADFSLAAVEPTLSQPTDIFTVEGSDLLYILEPANRRLLVFSKTGKLKNQYHSEKFDQLKDFAISEDGKKAYLLNAANIFSVDLVE